jgi:hypothetical protein
MDTFIVDIMLVTPSIMLCILPGSRMLLAHLMMMQSYIEDAAYYRINTSTRTPAAMFRTTMLV